jgi:Uma2 family endonuclease
MSLQPNPHLSFEDWLAGERGQEEERYEYLDGEVFAMSGGTAEHHVIISNINAELRAQFKGRPCQVYGQGMRLRIASGRAGKYPDLMALCGEPEFHDARRDLLLNPSLIVEVLSDSTEGYDRGEKFALYRQIPSLQEYLMISQTRISAELFTRSEQGRGEGGRWSFRAFEDLADRVTLASVGGELALAEVYDKVDLPRGPAPSA